MIESLRSLRRKKKFADEEEKRNQQVDINLNIKVDKGNDDRPIPSPSA